MPKNKMFYVGLFFLVLALIANSMENRDDKYTYSSDPIYLMLGESVVLNKGAQVEVAVTVIEAGPNHAILSTEFPYSDHNPTGIGLWAAGLEKWYFGEDFTGEFHEEYTTVLWQVPSYDSHFGWVDGVIVGGNVVQLTGEGVKIWIPDPYNKGEE